MEKIEIKGFVGIKDVTLEIKNINILIGPQASGKSIVAKLLFYFKNFIPEITKAAMSAGHKRDLDKNFKKRFEEYFPPSSWGSGSFSIRYSINQQFIEIHRKSGAKKDSSGIALSYSDFYKDKFTEFRNSIQKKTVKPNARDRQLVDLFRDELAYEIQQSFLSEIATELGRTSIFLQLYIPAGRSFFANLRSSIFTFLSDNNAVDPFLVEFGKYYERIKASSGLRNSQKRINNKAVRDEIALLNRKILCGKYIQKDGEDYLEINEGRTISIANSSSGQQETLPLSIILGTTALVKPDIGGTSIYIEEPEAHIFPSAQKEIVELIATVYNSRENSLQFLITTHSPYILTAFNNLLQAGSLAIDASDEALVEISR
jgi:AAA15 family ATPase/GTPase